MPKGDVLLHAGDLTNTGLAFEFEGFLDWFSSFSHPYKIFIAGNHDVTLDENFYADRGSDRFHSRRPVFSSFFSTNNFLLKF